MLLYLYQPGVQSGNPSSLTGLSPGNATTYATGTLTVGGTPTTSDTLTATVTLGATTLTSATPVITTGQTVAQVVAAYAAAINATPGVSALGTATPGATAVTFTAAAPGAAGGNVSILGTVTGGHTTVTPTSATFLTGGAGGASPAPWIGNNKIEPIEREVFDVTVAAPATLGQLLGVNPGVAPNSVGGCNWILNATASQKYGTFNYGICVKVASAIGSSALVRVSGVAGALCTTGGTAIAPGTALVADGAGNLTAVATPLFGQVLAISLGSLVVSTSTPTSVPVMLGGY